jgi:hypothetical protein
MFVPFLNGQENVLAVVGFLPGSEFYENPPAQAPPEGLLERDCPCELARDLSIRGRPRLRC